MTLSLGRLGRFQRAHPVLSGNVVLLAAMSISVLASYGFFTLYARALGPSDFGILAGWVALYSLLFTPLTGLSATVARLVAVYARSGDTAAIQQLVGRLRLAVVTGGGVAIVASLALSPAVSGFFHFPLFWYIPALAATLTAAAGVDLGRAVLGGKQQFGALGANVAQEGVGRLAIGWGVLGLGVGGGIAAYGASLLAALGVLAWLHRAGAAAPSRSKSIGPVWQRELPPMVWTAVALAAWTNLDPLIVRHFFPGPEGGLYLAASTIARLALVAGTATSVVILPLASAARTGRENTRLLLGRSLLLYATLLTPLLLVVWTVGEQAMRLLFGPAFAPAAQYLSWLTAASVAVGASTIMVTHQQALYRHGYLRILGVGVALLALLLWWNRSNLLALAQTVATVNLGMLCALAALIWLQKWGHLGNGAAFGGPVQAASKEPGDRH